ncbi:MAG: hypothetical protein CMM47_09960 [Rhodospirillaceae bacterium]|nr:hypothetical protein [Rhodospirillaceae bacterium]
MDFDVYLRFFVALAFTLSLIGLIYWLIRRYAPTRLFAPGGGGSRLQVVEVRQLDARRRLVLVQRDKTEHLLLLGIHSDLLIESSTSNQTQDSSQDGSFRAQFNQPARKSSTRPTDGEPT